MAASEASERAARAADDLYRRHGAVVYRYALAVLGNQADAEDVTQTTFLNAYRALEQGVRPRKPSSWLLAIASNAIKQRLRQQKARPREVELDERVAEPSDDQSGPTVGEVLTALSRISPQQRQALVLREFEGRSYKEIAAILGVTTSALETLLFRARRSLAAELEDQLTCSEAQFAISQAADGRIGRKEKRRLRAHLAECPDCARFAQLQKQHRRALRGLTLVPIPVSLALFKGMEGSASAATLPVAASGVAVTATGAGLGTTGAVAGGGVAAGVTLKVATVVTAAGLAGGVGVVGSTEEPEKKAKAKPAAVANKPGTRLGQVAPRGVLVPGRGVARGKANAPGQTRVRRPNAKPDEQTKASPPSGVERSSAKGNPPAAGTRGRGSPPVARGRSAQEPEPQREARAKVLKEPAAKTRANSNVTKGQLKGGKADPLGGS
jgi:RNA polymerase sigma-70 factor, ECF subfamily